MSDDDSTETEATRSARLAASGDVNGPEQRHRMDQLIRAEAARPRQRLSERLFTRPSTDDDPADTAEDGAA